MAKAPLSKIDIAAIRQADDFTVHLNHAGGTVRLIKRKHVTEREPFARDVEHILPADVALHGFRGQEEIKSGAAKCFAMVGIYHSQHSHASCILKTLRVDDELTFIFYPDAHTNGYVAMAGMHGDLLQLRVRRDGRTIAEWDIQSQVCPANSARMCGGIPNSSHYASDAAEARKVA